MNYILDEKQGIVLTNGHGVVTELELLGHLETFLTDPAVPLPIRDLHDLSQVSNFQITPETIHRILELSRANLSRICNGRIAIIAPNDFAFGMSRMLELLAGGEQVFETLRSEGVSPEVAVFREETPARKWLLSSVAAHNATDALPFSQRRA